MALATVTDRAAAGVRRGFVAIALGAMMAALAAGTVSAADEDVAITGFSYAPREVTVSVGDTVTWTNSDAQAHTASSDSGAFETNAIGNGASASVTFSTAGTFPYHCEFHPDMTGSVTVTGGLPPTDAATPVADPGAGSLEPLGAVALTVVFVGALMLGARRFRSA
jgi:plastocyanin